MNYDDDFSEDFIFDLNDVPLAKNNTDNSFCGANTEASPQNFSDGYLYDGDIPKAPADKRPVDLFYRGNTAEAQEITLSDMDNAEVYTPPQPQEEYRPRVMKIDYGEVDYEAQIESLDGEAATPADTAYETEKRAEQIYSDKQKYIRQKEDFYKDKTYMDDLKLSEDGEKIARIIGIDLIVISAIAIVFSFVNGTLVDFLAPVIRIVFCIIFMKGYKIGRYLVIFISLVSMYTPFVYLFASGQVLEPWRKVMYGILLMMYIVILYFTIRNKDIKQYCTKPMV